MTRIPIRTFLSMAIAFAYAVPAIAQDDKAPQMTPEQQAEMEAYIKAGTPGAAHAELAKTVGSYDLAIKHWQAPGAEPVEVNAGLSTPLGTGDRERVEATIALPPGARLLLYTDGLVERRRTGIIAGLERLREVVARPDLEIEDLCNTTIASMEGDGYADDVALLAVERRR